MSSYPPTPQRKACNCSDPCISTDDVYYAGPNLPNSGINTYNVLTEVIEKLDAIYAVSTATYKVYTALLTQIDENAPVPTVLENTLGGTVDWTREEAGNYIGTLNGAFPEGKTVCFYTHDGFNGVTGYGGLVRSDSNSVWMTFNNGTGEYVDSQGQSDSIEIRVYN